MQDLYMEYDDIVIGKRNAFSDRFFNKDKKRNMANALFVMRYALVRYLGWNADAIAENLNKDLMVRMHLQPLMKYVEYPLEYDKDKDYYYLVSLMFREKALGLKEKTIHTYESILNGRLSKYPKDYFVGSDGVVRAAICLQYLVTQEIVWTDVNDLYCIFASDRGYDLLKKYKLLNACREIFETPVDFIHFAMPKGQKDPFFYRYYKFKYLREMVNENGRKKKSDADYRLDVRYDDYRLLRDETSASMA